MDTENLHFLKRTFAELMWESLIHPVILWEMQSIRNMFDTQKNNDHQGNIKCASTQWHLQKQQSSSRESQMSPHSGTKRAITITKGNIKCVSAQQGKKQGNRLFISTTFNFESNLKSNYLLNFSCGCAYMRSCVVMGNKNW